MKVYNQCFPSSKKDLIKKLYLKSNNVKFKIINGVYLVNIGLSHELSAWCRERSGDQEGGQKGREGR